MRCVNFMKIPLKYSAICGMRCVNLMKIPLKYSAICRMRCVNLHEDIIQILGNLWYDICIPHEDAEYFNGNLHGMRCVHIIKIPLKYWQFVL